MTVTVTGLCQTRQTCCSRLITTLGTIKKNHLDLEIKRLWTMNLNTLQLRLGLYSTCVNVQGPHSNPFFKSPVFSVLSLSNWTFALRQFEKYATISRAKLTLRKKKSKIYRQITQYPVSLKSGTCTQTSVFFGTISKFPVFSLTDFCVDIFLFSLWQWTLNEPLNIDKKF